MPRSSVAGAGSCVLGSRRRFFAKCDFTSSTRPQRWPQIRRGTARKCGGSASSMALQPWNAAIEDLQSIQAPAGGRVVLFSQIYECASVIETFTRHYASLGFCKLLLYMDDPLDVAQDVLKEAGWIEAGFVEIIHVDAKLKSVWPSMPSWERVGQYAGMEVQSRQILNNEHALNRAKALGADWLLHVDSDELLCLPKTAPRFFADLSAQGCNMYTFSNVEGVPHSCDCTDVLQSVRVFRQNMGYVPRNPAAGAAFFSWQLRLGGFFISYENGKTAVSVKHAVKCLSVCMWQSEPQLELGKQRMADGSTCKWFTNNKLLWDAAVARRKEGRLSDREEVPRIDVSEAVLLHFCVCDFASFWRKRWSQLGYLSASDQFRVRASSGAMMARFYRLQRDGREAEARALYETMMVCEDPDVHVGVGVLLRIDPEESFDGRGWAASPRRPQYAALATLAEARGKPFEAFALLGKALQDTLSDESPCLDDLAALHCRRASCAMASGIASCAVHDAMTATELGEAAAYLVLASGLEALGQMDDAAEAVTQGLLELGSQGAQPVEVRSGLVAMDERLRHDAVTVSTDRISGTLRDKPLPTPAELQADVANAVYPEGKDSRLYLATLPVAMSWWQELSGDRQQVVKALARIANTTRDELLAVDASVRPMPLQFVRSLWDACESQLKTNGALVGDLEPMPSLWSLLAQQCHQVLGDAKTAVVVKDCNEPAHALHKAWQLLGGLAAEVQRVFNILDLKVLTELRIARLKPMHECLQATGGPEVDNGGLLPDNRREVSVCFFVPVDGQAPGPATTLLLHLKDGDQTVSHHLQAGRLFVWWSRQTFHQLLGADAYFSVSCWGIVPQKVDRSFCR